jgi:amino acid adenylation domain-containing protein/non-ribosomal peptide synthase protein (TIGR01720 family)
MEGKEGFISQSPQLARLTRDPGVEDLYTLSPTQSGLLFHSLYAPETGVYFEQHRSTIEGRLDTTAFVRAWQQAAERNAVLRTAFVWEGLEQPVQLVKRRVEIPCQVLDWRHIADAEREPRLDSFLKSDRAKGLDLKTAPLTRLTLIQLEEDEWRLIWSHHHLILDGLSLSLLLDEVMSLYHGLVRGQPLPDDSKRPYRDYIEWLEAQDRSAAEAFWREALAGFTAPTTLPLPKPKSTNPSAADGREGLVLPSELTASLERFARRHQLSLETLVQGAFGIMLRRYCGDDDVVYGLIVSGRSAALAGIDRMVGLFLNAVPLRVRLSGSDEILPVLEKIGEARRSLEPFEHASLLDMQRWSLLGREVPLFENLLMFENEIPERVWGDGSGARVRVRDVAICERTKYPLTLVVTAGSRLKLQLLWDGRRFEPIAVQRMAAHFARLLEAIAAAPRRRVADLPFLSEAERQQLVLEWSTMDAHSVESCLHERFEEQVEERPDAVALVDEGAQLTYGFVNARANQVAHHLCSLGIGCEAKVAICLERSAELVVAILGALKAGAAYLPLDPNYPRERLEFMLRDAGASVLLSHHRLRERLPSDQALVLVDLDADRGLVSCRDDGNPDVTAHLDQLAYMIYTSGSTGTPKGVEITHRNVMRLFRATEERFRFDGNDVWTLFHSYAFDFSVWELFGALLYGGRLVVVPYLTSRSPELFDELLRRERVSVLNQTPSAFRSLVTLRGAQPPDETDLRWVIFGGEALDFALVESWLGRPGIRPRLVNMYGITETTVHVTYRALEPENAAASWGSRIGVPISDLEVSLLDGDGNVSPLCVPGEIHVGGAGLARGYRSRPQTTAERFVPHPAGSRPGARLYRTGDWARYWPDRDLEFLGRMDQQVKVRGFRVELGEIEAALEQHPAVRQCAVVVRNDSPGERRIVGYVVSDGSAFSGSELRAHLQKKLPEHMVPAVFAFVDELPLTPSGKLDTKALPAPDGARRQVEEDYVAPRNPTEVALSHIWQEVLGLDRVGVHDNFFALGGDSILSIQVVARSGARGLHLTPRQIFQFPTIAELAPLAGQESRISAEQQPVTGPVEMTPIQKWYLEIESEPRHFNQALLLEVTHRLDPSLIRQTLAELLVHHDALRLRLERDGSAFRLDNRGLEAARAQGVFIHIDLLSLSATKRGGAIEEASAQLQASLDPAEAPLIRAAWFEMGSSSHRLLLAAHHLAVDGVSWRVLLEDMFSAYEQRRRGRPTLLPPKTTSFQAWSKRLRDYARSEGLASEASYWREILAGDSGRLPLDGTEGENISGSAETVTVSLSRHETRALLQGVPAAYRTQINDLLLSALALELTAWCGSDSVLVDLEGHGREDLFEDVDVSRTVGWFTTIFPVRLSVGDRNRPSAVLKRVKEELRRIPRGGIGYGLLRYLRDDPEQTELPTQRPAVSFNYLGQLDAFLAGGVPVRIASESIGANRSPGSRRTHLLEINGAVRDGELQFGWTYSRNRHARATIEKRASHFLEFLRGLINHCQQPENGGVTPSDFPLALLQQAELDDLVGTGRDVDDIYPLAPVQRGILFHSIGGAGPGPYFEQFWWGVEGNIEPELMRRAWERLLQRHGVLRTAFVWDGLRRPLQIVYRSARLAWQYQDWRGDPPDEQEARLRRFLDADRGLAFDLARPPLLRVALLRVAESRWYVAWSHHHLILDAWSIDLQWKELMLLYETLRRDQEIRLERPRPYRDFVAWLEKRDLSDAEAFWRRTLQGLKAPTRLGLERPQDVSGTLNQRYRHDRALLPEADASDLQQFARRERLDVDTLVRAAFAILLSRYTRESDVLFGTTVNGRSASFAGIESMIGPLMSTLSLRLKPRPARSTIPWLKEVQQHFAEALQYEHTPLSEVQRWSDVPPAAGGPLLESLVVLENRPFEPSRLTVQGRLSIWSAGSNERTSFPITLFVATRSSWSLEIAYDARRYDEASMTRMLGHLQSLLRGIAAAQGGILSELSLLSAAERRELLESRGWAKPDLPVMDRLRELFDARSREQADAAGGVLDGDSMGSDIDLYLLDSQLEPVPIGVAGEIHVGGPRAARGYSGTSGQAAENLLPHPFSQVPGARLYRAGELGCLGRHGTISLSKRAGGGAYHRRGVLHPGAIDGEPAGPADPRPDPPERYVAPRTEAEKELCRIWASVLGVDRVGVLDDFFELGGDSAAGIQIACEARRAGLRMMPGQLLESPTIADLGEIVSEPFEIGSENIALTGSGPLTPNQHWFLEQRPTRLQGFGATLVIELIEPLEEVHLDAALRQLLVHHEALQLRFRGSQSGLSQDNTGSDQRPQPLLSRIDLRDVSETARIASEARAADELPSSLDVSRGPLLRGVLLKRRQGTADRLLLAGHPLVVDFVSWRILVEDLMFLARRAQRGERAQLRSKTTSFRQWAQQLKGYASGDAILTEVDHWSSVADGEYARLPVDGEGFDDEDSGAPVIVDLTEDETRFLVEIQRTAEPMEIDEILLTALVRVIGEWTGRLSILLSLERAGREEGILGGVDLSRTVGSFTIRFPARIDISEARDLAADYELVRKQLRAIPHCGIGYGLLRYMRDDGLVSERLAHSPELTFSCLGTWRSALSDKVSLPLATEPRTPHALEVYAALDDGRLRTRWSFSPSVHRRSTMERLAEKFSEHVSALIQYCRSERSTSHIPPNPPAATVDAAAALRLSIGGDIEDIYPLSPMQSGLLFHSLYAPHSSAYFDQHSCTLEGPFDGRAFRDAWQRTVERHAILRTCFAWEGLDEPMQIVRPHGELPWLEHDWRNLKSDLRNERLESLLHADRMRGFDLKRAPLMRLSLIRLSETSWNLVWSHHHLLLDGWSVPLLLGEVMLIYESSLQGHSLDLGAPTAYRSYIDWLKTQDLSAAETFWRKTLGGFTQSTPLKIGGSSPGAIGRGEAHGEAEILLSRELTAALERFARRERMTANTVIQGAWALLLSRYSGREDVLFGATVSGRSAPIPGIESAVGLFINAVPVRVHVRPTARLSLWLKELQQHQAEARHYEYAPLAEVQAWSDVPQGAPLFESLLAFENYPLDRTLREHGGSLRIRDVRVYDRTNYPLTLVIVPGEELLLRANYDRHRFTDSSMRRLLGRLSGLIENMVSREQALLEELQIDTELEIGSAPPILPGRTAARGSELPGSSRGG